jgi:hypothetical protein
MAASKKTEGSSEEARRKPKATTQKPASQKTGQAGWLDAVLRLERAIGSQVEQFVRSDAYFDLTAELARQRKRVSKHLEGFQEEWLHLFNLPAGTDIRRLREQLARLEREVADLTQELADRREATEGTRRTSADTRPSA